MEVCGKFLLDSLILLSCNILLVSSSLPFPVNAPNQLIPKGSVNDWVHQSELSVILFSNEVTLAANPQAVVERFEHVGPKLNSYGIQFGVYDCEEDPEFKHCGAKLPDSSVIIYFKGTYLLDIPVDGLYDDASILSNLLQILLLHEVPLIQTSGDLLDHMRLAVQKSMNFLLLFVKGIGTKEHADYMEVVKKALDTDGIDLQFAHSTSHEMMKEFTNTSPTQSLAEELLLSEDEVHLYYMSCSDIAPAKHVICPVYHFLDGYSTHSLNRYVQTLSFTGLQEKAMKEGLATVSCFYGTDEEKSEVMKLSDQLSAEMKGLLLFYWSPSSDGSEVEQNLYKDIGALCSIRDPGLDVEAMIRLDSVRGYIIENVLVQRRKTTLAPNVEKDADTLSDADATIAAVEKQDDNVDIADNALGGVKDLDVSSLVVLDRESFKYHLFSGIILFHIMKYDHKSRMVLRLYNEAAAEFTDRQLTIIDCYDWTDICRQNNVTSFPTIRLYKKGKYRTYNGPFSTPALIKMAYLYEFGAPHVLDSMTDVMKLKKDLDDSKTFIIFVGLFVDHKCKEFNAYKQAASGLAGQHVMIAAVGNLADTVRNQFGLDTLPVIASLNTQEKNHEKAVKYYERKTFSVKSIESFIHQATLPSFVELTPSSLPLVQISRRPQLLFFTNDLKSDIFTVVEQLAADNSLKNKFGFNYLPTEGNSVNQRILKALTDRVKSPTVLVCDYVKGKQYHYNFDGGDAYTSKHVKQWLQQISIGNVEANRNLPEGEWKGAHPGYDFLAQIEKDKLRKKPEHDRLNILATDEAGGDGTTGPPTMGDSSTVTPAPERETTADPLKHTEL